MSRAFLYLLALGLWAVQAMAQPVSGLARFEAGQVSDISGGVAIDLELSQGVPWRLFTLDDPRRLVLDFREVDWTGADPEEMAQSDSVAALRMGPFQSGWSRMVVDLAEPLAISSASMRVDRDSGRAELRLALSPTSEEAFAEAAGVTADPAWDGRSPTARRTALRQPGDPVVIVLDPGHGGIDPGAERDGVNEADLMLTFAQELREVLLRAGNYRVSLTRTEDVFVSLEARVAKAHDAGADLFISLHADALAEGMAHGAAVYTLAEEASDAASAALAERHNRDDLLSGLDLSGADDRVAQVLLDLARVDNTPRSQALAEHLVDGIRNALGHVHKDPMREAGFSVLKSADIPSVLIELGFLSTARDLKNLQDPAWRAGMAAGIRDGIAAWELEDAALARLRRQ
ncbi:N-acetylmuramoyl-L-alanine amidase [Ponticoccus alexandrii]|uniref:N-acetylmuramoyl-L-alanine amidase n=1 Tax=Ponticoccus alexandrii TaxID=1943633 RepID=A0ABX7F7K3_9RHOB|nr:N-acetylmuramoyl-L-alanine amidase [Ponticoccus alexandrii]ETA51429.1 N-acetylmuramoyl-L-alanine amidase [Rhodobacteraceae bacterium PD-2]QRF66516.1 AMIN domain-containing protein [Ponticoccus alexandrii]